MIQPGRLVTLLGPAGAGKTRLSIEVGFNTVERWPDGVWFVDLAPLSAGEVVPNAIADAINASSAPDNDSLADLLVHLADRSLLLVLDNCEHLVEAIAHLVHELLRRCPGVGVLATSLVPLGLLNEKPYRLQPLVADDAGSDAVGCLSNAPASAPTPTSPTSLRCVARSTVSRSPSNWRPPGQMSSPRPRWSSG